MNTKLSAPWYTYQKKLSALFGGDAQIEVSDVTPGGPEGADYIIYLVVYNHEKFLAIDRTIVKTVSFGNVTLAVVPVDAEQGNGDHRRELYDTIFGGNKIVKDIREVTDKTGATHGFIRFQPEVIQFPNDDASDYNGNWSGLAQDIAREVFCDCGAGIHFCTAEIQENDKTV